MRVGNYHQNKNWQVISDTGTSLLGAPNTVADGIARAVGGKYDPSYGLVSQTRVHDPLYSLAKTVSELQTGSFL